MVNGFFLMPAFVLWEWNGAQVPMAPRELFAGQRIVAFVAGMYYYALAIFIPLLNQTVYNLDPIQVGLKALAPGFSTVASAIGVNIVLSLWKWHSRVPLIGSSVLMS
jgi:hypothetical protein